MEQIPSAEKETEKIEKFNFPEIENLAEPMIELCSKLKNNFDTGKYRTLLSDDIGGRIPTLVIANVLKKLRHDISVSFVAAGHSTPGSVTGKEWKGLVRHLKEKISPEGSVLLITQFIHHGDTIGKLLLALQQAGFNNIDVASARSLYPEEVLNVEFNNQTYIGDRSSTMDIDSKHNFYTGLAKSGKTYNPSPQLLTKVIEEEGRERFMHQEIDQIFDLKPDDRVDVINEKFKDPHKKAIFEARIKEPLSEEEKIQLRENILKTREDVKTMADLILQRVWNIKAEKGL
ncbi:MAG TPA: hypothetical protein VFA52_00340 [Candidatus Paceibacterota bacterium]|nr:hypothetical protein [Candidatus Paceibacterota bacterium]